MSAYLTVAGRVGRAPELKESASGPWMKVSVASGGRKKIDGQWTDVTTWFDVTVFGARATSLAKIIRPGHVVAASGSLDLRVYAKKDGTPGASISIAAQDFELLAKPLGEASSASAEDSDDIPF